jgi:acetyl esterase/lipase
VAKTCLTLIAVVAATSSIAAAQSVDAVPQRISYGTAPTSFRELIMPLGSGPFPVAVLLHGGCWLSTRSSLADIRAIAAMLAKHGIASWNVEYRRVGHAGGGWPGTFRDVSDATDFVRELARTHPLDLQRVVPVGHSSGGYFAAWIAGRHNLPAGSPLVGSSPLKLAGLVLLDAFLDPRVIDSRGVDGRLFCDETILPRLIGGTPEASPEHLRQASPLALLPFGVPQAYVVSSLRYPVTPTRPLAGGRTTLAVLDYPALANGKGDSVSVHIVPDADHFDFLKPTTNAWPAVEDAIVKIFGAH